MRQHARLRHHHQVPFGASVSGDKNPVPDSTRKKVREGFGALSYGEIVPNLRLATPLDVGEAVRIGPSPMPVFGPQTLPEQGVWDVASYVQYLHHPDDRGGLSLAHLGPIPEGFVAWLGLAIFLVAARLIGTRA